MIQLIASTNQLHSYSVRQLLFAMKEDNSQQPLCQVASWCIGEYGEQLLQPSAEEDEHGPVSTYTQCPVSGKSHWPQCHNFLSAQYGVNE